MSIAADMPSSTPESILRISLASQLRESVEKSFGRPVTVIPEAGSSDVRDAIFNQDERSSSVTDRMWVLTEIPRENWKRTTVSETDSIVLQSIIQLPESGTLITVRFAQTNDERDISLAFCLTNLASPEDQRWSEGAIYTSINQVTSHRDADRKIDLLKKDKEITPENQTQMIRRIKNDRQVTSTFVEINEGIDRLK